MRYTSSILWILGLILMKDNIFGKFQSFIGPKNLKSDVILDIDLKETNQTERDLLICNSGSTAQLVKIEVETESGEYSRLCDHTRNLSDFRISVNITVKGKRRPVLAILNVNQFKEERVNGSVKVSAIGFTESGLESLRDTSFYAIYDVPNLNPGACYSIEGLTRQTGVGELIFSKIDNRRVPNLYSRYTNEQLVAIFRKYTVGDCIGHTVLSYIPGLLNEKVLDELYPISNLEKRETSAAFEQLLDECEPLPANILRIEEKSKYIIYDSCDAVDLFDRFEDDLVEFQTFIGSTNISVATQVKIIYSNGFRVRGSFYGIAIGIIISGPAALLGDSYLEILDMPNFNPYACQAEPGVVQQVGSTEKIIANLDVQNLLSVMDLDSILTKIRSNRIADCIGSISGEYSPGLVFSDVLIGQNNLKKDEQKDETTNRPKWKNYFKYNPIKKIFVDKMGGFKSVPFASL